MISTACKNFIRWQSLGGTLMLFAAAGASALAGAGMGTWFDVLREPVLGVTFGSWGMGKPVLVWINQVAMTAVLFLSGLECKRAFMDGELIGTDRLGLPALAAFGGLLASGLVCAVLGLRGAAPGDWWLVPLGIDMALGLAVLSWLGERVPGVLKAFFVVTSLFTLMAAAVLAAVMHAALPPWPVLALAGGCVAALLALNLGRVEAVAPYLVPATVLWLAAAQSPVWSALAGLFAAFFIPCRTRGQSRAPLQELEQDLLPVVCCVVLPLMTLANAAFPWDGAVGVASAEPRALAVLAGIFPARAAGMLAMCWLGARLRICALPPGVNWKELSGTALLCGAGFTVNVFLGTAVAGPGATLDAITLAAMCGAALSILAGYLFLRQVLARRRNKVVQRT